MRWLELRGRCLAMSELVWMMLDKESIKWGVSSTFLYQRTRAHSVNKSTKQRVRSAISKWRLWIDIPKNCSRNEVFLAEFFFCFRRVK